MDLKHIRLSEMNQRKMNIVYYYLNVESKKSPTCKKKKKMVVTRGAWWGIRLMVFKGTNLLGAVNNHRDHTHFNDYGQQYCTQNASKFGKLSSGYGIGKDQFSFHFQTFLAMPKNVQTTTQMPSFHVLTR